VEAFAAWAERSGPAAPPPDTLRLRRPEVVLDPWGEGITLYLPSQPIPAKHSLASIAWQVAAGPADSVPISLPSRVRQVGAEWRTADHTLTLKQPADRATIDFFLDGERKRGWAYLGPDREFPLLTFEVNTLPCAGPALPAGSPVVAGLSRRLRLEAERGIAHLCEEAPRLSWGWGISPASSGT